VPGKIGDPLGSKVGLSSQELGEALGKTLGDPLREGCSSPTTNWVRLKTLQGIHLEAQLVRHSGIKLGGSALGKTLGIHLEAQLARHLVKTVRGVKTLGIH
jgi:hypothetical protein